MYVVVEGCVLVGLVVYVFKVGVEYCWCDC